MCFLISPGKVAQNKSIDIFVFTQLQCYAFRLSILPVDFCCSISDRTTRTTSAVVGFLIAGHNRTSLKSSYKLVRI